MDVYAIVTEKIINLLEQGVVPWRRPWTGGGLPRNVASKKPYRGINHFLLSVSRYVQPYWLTMRQANELGGRVRRGEKSTVVVFWKVEDCRENNEGSRSRREQRQEQSSFSAQVLPHFQSRTMRTATSSPRQTTQGRNAGAHADQCMRGDCRLYAERAGDSARWIESVLQRTD